MMKLGLVSSRTLFRKPLCSFLSGVGIFAAVIEFSSIWDFIGSNQREPLVLMIHTGNAAPEIESLQQIHHLFPQARVLFIADDPDEEFCVKALEAGAWGCLSTTETPQALVKAVAKVSDGERWFDHRVTNAVLNRLLPGRESDAKFVESLTHREWEVLALIAEGRSDKEVASSLFISKETERSHVKSIYRKLQVSTRREAAVCYFKHVRGKSVVQNQPLRSISTSASV